ncbi:hypothetical protein H5410_043719 [Solanum commersonii]|uniref:Uncharacterized protein n=1 Tax=Solanum commersonii TaxID=4109 RepID=A0A9J5XZ68_SOLCO|nr:hypothetical protein H5410_043719 [Solanum commersonii]
MLLAPAVSPPPASPSGSTRDSPLQISVTTSTPEAAAPIPLGSTSDWCTPEAVAPSPLESTRYRPLEVLSGEEETKSNVNPSRILKHPPKTNYTLQHILDENSKKVIVKVESLLVQSLLTSGNDVDYMVHQANSTFKYLKGLGADYGSSYRDVAEHIKYCCDLQDMEKEETMLCLSALQKKYENDILTVNDVEENLGRTRGELEMAKDKKKTLKRQINDLKTEVARIEHEEECLKHNEIKYKEAHEVAKAKMEELGTRLEAGQEKQREIRQRKNAALRGIESTTRHLQSTFLDNLDYSLLEELKVPLTILNCFGISNLQQQMRIVSSFGGTDEGPRTTVIQETNVSPSIQEEGQTTNCRVISTVGSTAESSPNELFLSFRVDITIEKAPFQAEVRMSAEINDIPVPSPPGFTYKQVGDRTSPGRRHSSRKRDSPDFFVPTPFGPSLRLHGQGLRRGPGRPPKQRLDESSASQPLRRGPGRPQRKRSDAPTNAPEVVLPPPVPPTGSNQNIPEQVSMSTNSELVPPPPVPPTGSNKNIPEQVSMSTNSELVPPPHVPPTGSNENIPEQVSMSTKSKLVPPPPVPPTGSNENIPEQVSMSTKSELVPPPPVPPTGSNENIPEQISMSTNSELVPPSPVPPLGSISDTPLLIPCDEEDDQRETNLKVNPLSRLETPKQTPSQNQMPEKSKKMLTDEVQSVLVSRISSGTTTSVDDMVNFANSAFSTLNWIGDDYSSFYEDVKHMISYKYDLFIAERDRDVCSVSELEKQRFDAFLRSYNIDKEIKHIRAKQEKDKQNKEKSKKLIEDARGMIQRLEQVIPSLEQQVAAIEQDEKCMKDDEQKHRAAHRIALAEAGKVSTQINEARAVQMDAERRRNEALQGIESTKRRLQSCVEG